MSQSKTVQEDVAWDTLDEEEEEAGAGLKGSSPQHTPVTTTMEGDMVSLMQDFLAAQQRQKEGLIDELRGLRESIQRRNSPESTQSLRFELPKPAARRNEVTSAVRHQTGSQPSADPLRVTEQHPVLLQEQRMPVYQEGEDIENYLWRFERLARITWGWPEEEWVCRLVPLLTGKALEAYIAMDEDRAEVYKDLREALLEKCNLSAETYNALRRR